MTRMEGIEDRLALVDLLSEYTACVDSRDWQAWQALFTERVVWDFESLGAGPAVEAPIASIAEQVIGLFSQYSATHHAATNHRVTVHGDEGRIRAHIRAEHWIDPEAVAPASNRWLVTGFYDHLAVRTPHGWRLSRIRLVVTHQEGEHVRAAAVQRRDRLATGD